MHTSLDNHAFFESILLRDGQLPLLTYHQQRVDRSRRVAFPKHPSFKLAEIIGALELPATGRHKVRITYGSGLGEAKIVPYTIRQVNSLRVVDADGVDYGRKRCDRSGIDTCFAQREDCDDIIMTQHGYLTDSSYANLALYDGKRWYTPSWPLLRGTRRRALIDGGILQPAVIRGRDLPHFESVRLINAMMDWEEGPEIPLGQIVYD